MPQQSIKATVTVAFSGAVDGEIYPRQFRPGDVIHGDLARVAIAEKWAEVPKPAATPPAAAADRRKAAVESAKS